MRTCIKCSSSIDSPTYTCEIPCIEKGFEMTDQDVVVNEAMPIAGSSKGTIAVDMDDVLWWVRGFLS